MVVYAILEPAWILTVSAHFQEHLRSMVLAQDSELAALQCPINRRRVLNQGFLKPRSPELDTKLPRTASDSLPTEVVHKIDFVLDLLTMVACLISLSEMFTGLGCRLRG